MRPLYETPSNGDFERYVQQLLLQQQRRNPAIAALEQALALSASKSAGSSPGATAAKTTVVSRAAKTPRAYPASRDNWDEDNWGQSQPAAGQRTASWQTASSASTVRTTTSASPAATSTSTQKQGELPKNLLQWLWVAGLLLLVFGRQLFWLILPAVLAAFIWPPSRNWLLAQIEKAQEEQRR